MVNMANLICAAYVSLMLPNADIACEHMEIVIEASDQNYIDPTVLISLIYVESRWTPTATSKSNACGLTQVLPRYSAGRNNRFGKKLTCRDLKDPNVSIHRGARVLNFWFYKYARRNLKYALCGYSKGFRCKQEGKPRKVGMRYAQKVMKLARKIQRKIKIIQKSKMDNQ